MRYVAALATLLLLGASAASVVQNGSGRITRAVVVKRAATFQPVSRTGLLGRPTWLDAYARLGDQAEVGAGRNEITAMGAPLEFPAVLHVSTVENFTMAAGLNRWRVRSLLADAQWITLAEFDALCDDAAFLEQNEIPGPSCEGYLSPGTYHEREKPSPSGEGWIAHGA